MGVDVSRVGQIAATSAYTDFLLIGRPRSRHSAS